mmetsp:Transcript_1486/g.4453  ORF Transcript_1486/g.4453 Transcript_1486/m.4453 type:complete len:205 (-) Transcript_1486:87-701(-)
MAPDGNDTADVRVVEPSEKVHLALEGPHLVINLRQFVFQDLDCVPFRFALGALPVDAENARLTPLTDRLVRDAGRCAVVERWGLETVRLDVRRQTEQGLMPLGHRLRSSVQLRLRFLGAQSILCLFDLVERRRVPCGQPPDQPIGVCALFSLSSDEGWLPHVASSLRHPKPVAARVVSTDRAPARSARMTLIGRFGRWRTTVDW